MTEQVRPRLPKKKWNKIKAILAIEEGVDQNNKYEVTDKILENLREYHNMSERIQVNK